MPNQQTLSIGVAIFTYNAAKFIPVTIPLLKASAEVPRILVVDSSSRDGTADIARALGVDVEVIPTAEFDHGLTREFARKQLGTDIAVMMTQDAIPAGQDLLTQLVAPLRQGKASASYARQIPHDGAGFLEAFPRSYNYPAQSHLRSMVDLPRLGTFTFFCSDSCAAWSNRALDSVGGFAQTLSLEDTILAAKLIWSGHRIAYCADAIVKHSHSYSLRQEFTRSFDIGYVRSEQKELLLCAGGDEKRGIRYAAEMIRKLAATQPWLMPYAAASIASRYIGYRLGYHGHHLPAWLKRKLSGMPGYWS
jgi:rhamnosyltransferase